MQASLPIPPIKPDPNLIETSTSVFVEYYNKNIPKNFPRASLGMLEKFRARYPNLFKGSGDEWTIEKHRKKLMDWLASYK
ncbi:MAG: hypothetical protein AAB505_02945 [Patescibacteria group bacterium]